MHGKVPTYRLLKNNKKEKHMTNTIIIYGKTTCPYCDHAKAFFDQRKIAYTYLDVGSNADNYNAMQEATNGKARTVPQIIINNHAIGGYDNLRALDESGELNNLLT